MNKFSLIYGMLVFVSMLLAFLFYLLVQNTNEEKYLYASLILFCVVLFGLLRLMKFLK